MLACIWHGILDQWYQSFCSCLQNSTQDNLLTDIVNIDSLISLIRILIFTPSRILLRIILSLLL